MGIKCKTNNYRAKNYIPNLYRLLTFSFLAFNFRFFHSYRLLIVCKVMKKRQWNCTDLQPFRNQHHLGTVWKHQKTICANSKNNIDRHERYYYEEASLSHFLMFCFGHSISNLTVGDFSQTAPNFVVDVPTLTSEE